MGYIYKITNTKNNKCYVGVTTKENPEHRWRDHKYAIKNGTGCPLLMAAFNKYGEEAFKFEVLIICFDEDVYKYEQTYINKYISMSPNGYNVAEGGKMGRNFLGRKHSEETKKKMGIKSINYNSSPEVRERARQRMIEFNKNNNVSELIQNSEKWQKALAEGRIGNKGGTHSEETKNKISESVKEYHKLNNNTLNINQQTHSDIMTKAIGRKVSQFNKDGTLIATFNSIQLASKNTSINRNSIQSTAAGRANTGGGFIWKYADIEEKELKDQPLK